MSILLKPKCLILKIEIMNLENLNLVELNAQEVQETEGGFIPLIILGIILFGTNRRWRYMQPALGVGIGIAVYSK
jgi:hypothetical protein